MHAPNVERSEGTNMASITKYAKNGTSATSRAGQPYGRDALPIDRENFLVIFKYDGRILGLYDEYCARRGEVGIYVIHGRRKSKVYLQASTARNPLSARTRCLVRLLLAAFSQVGRHYGLARSGTAFMEDLAPHEAFLLARQMRRIVG